MNPLKVFFSLAAVLIILGIVAFFFPKEGLRVGDLELRMPSIKDIFFEEKVEYANIEQLIEQEEAVKTTDRENKNLIQPKEIKDNVVRFAYSAQMKGCFAKLFEAFAQIKQENSSVRILHYGDSQIEADRITGRIRKQLQDEYGGFGQGVIPMHSLSQVKGVSYNYSTNWQFNGVLRPQSSNSYGLMLSSIKAVEDSVNGSTSWVEIAFADKPKGRLTIYYSIQEEESRLRVLSNNIELQNVSVSPSEELQRLEITPNSVNRVLRIEAGKGIELHGIDLSQNYGVYVDNVSLRGSSGWGIRQSNSLLMHSMAEDLNVQMIIMQFGVNAIPQEADRVISDYGFYKREFSKQLQYLHKVAPKALIVVVGVSDRSIKKGSSYETNPNIEKLRKAQREAALENDCVFWDLFEAMGGKNSMPSWVLREKPLANKDFIHFNDAGAGFVANMFLDALRIEYEDYKLTYNDKEDSTLNR